MVRSVASLTDYCPSQMVLCTLGKTHLGAPTGNICRQDVQVPGPDIATYSRVPRSNKNKSRLPVVDGTLSVQNGLTETNTLEAL